MVFVYKKRVSKGLSRCSSFTDCGPGWLLKANAANIAGSDRAACCVQACGSFVCPPRFNQKPGVENMPGNDTEACCVRKPTFAPPNPCDTTGSPTSKPPTPCHVS